MKKFEQNFSAKFSDFQKVNSFVTEFDYLLENLLEEEAHELCYIFLTEQYLVEELKADFVCEKLAKYPYKITNRNAIGFFLKRMPIIIVVVVVLLLSMFRFFEVFEKMEVHAYEYNDDDSDYE